MKLSEFEAKMAEMKKMSLQEAMTRSDFAAFMSTGLKATLVTAYQQAAADATWQQLVQVEDSDKDLETYPSMGDPEMPRLVNEGQDFEQLNPGSPDNVKVTNFKYGGLIALTEEAGEDDQTPGKALMKQADALGRKHMELKDKVFYSLINANPTIYDGGAWFALNHPGYTGGATRSMNDNIYTNVTLSANALATIIGITAQWEGADADEDLNVRVTDLVVPVTLQQTALGLTRADLLPFGYAAGPLGPATNNGGMPNAMKGKLGVISSQRLDRSSTTDWYWKTNFGGFIYQRRKGIQVLQEAANAGQAFNADILRWKSKERFGRKVINWRWGGKVS